MDEIIRLKDVSISHEEGPLLTNVNFELHPGEFVYLIGKSGAGKTSLLRALYGDKSIDSGEAYVCGYDVAHLKRREAPMLRRKIGVVFQNFRLLPDRNVYDNLYFVLKATGWKRKEIDARIVEVLQSVGIENKITSRIFRLSEGEQQRVGIARALINNPSLILADEPTGNLDPITSTEIMELLQKINAEKGVPMIISTHDFMMIDRFPHRIVGCENQTLVTP